MNAICAIARNTWVEAIRARILYVFLGFALALIVGSTFISMMTIGDPTKIVKDIGLFAMQLFGMLIAVMMSVLMVSREQEQRTIHTVLSKPLGRFEYLLGKYIGLLAITATMLALMGIALILIVFIHSLSFEPLLLFGVVMTLLEMSLMAAFALLFATLTKPILGSVLTLATFVVGHMTGALLLLQDRWGNAITDTVVPVLYYLMPNLEVFNYKVEIVHGLALPWMAILWSFVYGLLYSGIVMTINWLHFRGRDIE